MSEPNELDTAMSAFIKETQAEFAAAAPADPVEEAPAPETPAEPVVPTELAIAAEEPAVERGLERLVAREVELRERETRLAGAQKEMEALHARIRDLESRALSPELLDKIKWSPQEGLKALGLDPDEVVKAALVEKMGDKANDPETRALLERSKMRKEMEQLRAQVLESERKQAAQAYFATVQNGAVEFTRKLDGLSKETPTVSAIAKNNPERVFQEIMEEITRDAASRAAREPGGDIISYEEAAKRVEQRWSAMKALFGGPLPGETPKPAPNAGMPTPKTNVEAKPDVKSPPSTIKPPEKPLAPWQQRDVDADEGIRAAIAEWRRAESLK